MTNPAFRYHPDPVASGVFVPFNEPCPSCGQRQGLGYVGPFFADTDFDGEGICADCIASGAAAAKWDAEFTDADLPEPLDSTDKLDHLLRRTPGYFSADGESWPVHCGDYCALVGQVTWGAISPHEAELSDDLQGLEEALGLDRDSLITELSRESSPLWAHLFRCVTCGRHRLTAGYE